MCESSPKRLKKSTPRGGQKSRNAEKRGENMPSIEVASKLTDALGVTLDYLIKDDEYEQLDTTTLKRLKEVEKLPQEVKNKLYFFIDMTVRDFKASKAYSFSK